MREEDIKAVVEAVVARVLGSAAAAGGSEHFAYAVAADAVSEALEDAGEEALEDITAPEFKKRCGVERPHKEDVLRELQRSTGARLGVGKVGVRPPTRPYLRFLADHARSKGTVFREVPEEWLEKNGLWSIKSRASDKDEYLTRPDLGRMLDEDTIATLKKRFPEKNQVLIVLSDGLSTDALLSNYEEVLPPLVKGLKNAGLSVGSPFFLRYGRVKAQDAIGQALGCDVVLLLIGERPGLGQSESMSCYAVYRPTPETNESQRMVISNIHKGGLPPVEAAAVIVDLAMDMIRHQAGGIELNRKKAANHA